MSAVPKLFFFYLYNIAFKNFIEEEGTANKRADREWCIVE